MKAKLYFTKTDLKVDSSALRSYPALDPKKPERLGFPTAALYGERVARSSATGETSFNFGPDFAFPIDRGEG